MSWVGVATGCPSAGGSRLWVGQHQDPGLGLGLGRQRHVHGHLVAVEVGVVSGADQRVNLDGAAFHQHRLEGLDAQPVQRGRAVEQHRMLLDDFLQDVPHLGADPLHHALGALDVVGQALVHQPLHDEGLEELQGHLLGQAALVQLQLRPDDDDRTARVVHALAQQVLAEPALLALEHVAQGLQRPVARTGHRPAAAAVVDEGVHGLLEHPLFVADDDVGRAQLQQPLQAVVAVDHAPVQVVEVRGGEAAAVQLHHGPQFRRDDGDDVQDHPLGPVARLAEGFHHLQAADGPHPALAAWSLRFPGAAPRPARPGRSLPAAP